MLFFSLDASHTPIWHQEIHIPSSHSPTKSRVSVSHSHSVSHPFALLQSIATIRGDLSNITAPPFVLATKSAVEFPAYWAEHPAIFVAPASEADPQRRALSVLKWFLAALKQQQYAGRDEKEGVKKPLNAFLGELFLASFEGGNGVKGTTRLVSEQVRYVTWPPQTSSEMNGLLSPTLIVPLKPPPASNSLLSLERRARHPSTHLSALQGKAPAL